MFVSVLIAYAAVAVATPPAAPVRARQKGPDDFASPPVRNGKTVGVTIVGVTGLNVTATAARGGDTTDHVGSVSLNSRRLGYAYDQGLVVRVHNGLELGGNDRGFHGGVSFEAAGGYRFHVTETQGPFVRAGVDAVLRGDALVYQSLLELPQGHAGYQYLAGDTLLEVAGHTGLSLLGRSNTGDHASRSLDQSFEAGAMATARTGPLLAIAGWSHFLARGAGAAVDWLDFALCARAKRFAVCTDARFVVGDVHLSSGTTASSTVSQVGLTVGTAGK